MRPILFTAVGVGAATLTVAAAAWAAPAAAPPTVSAGPEVPNAARDWPLSDRPGEHVRRTGGDAAGSDTSPAGVVDAAAALPTPSMPAAAPSPVPAGAVTSTGTLATPVPTPPATVWAPNPGQGADGLAGAAGSSLTGTALAGAGSVFGSGGAGIPAGSGLSADAAKASLTVSAPAQLYPLIVATFGPAETTNALAVATCESSLRADAVGKTNRDGSRDWGLFQLNDHGSLQEALAAIGHPAPDVETAQRWALDPAINVAAAKAMFDARGWQPWTCAATMGIVDQMWSAQHGPNYGAYRLAGTH